LIDWLIDWWLIDFWCFLIHAEMGRLCPSPYFLQSNSNGDTLWLRAFLSSKLA
jgi:hypothetical protein